MELVSTWSELVPEKHRAILASTTENTRDFNDSDNAQPGPDQLKEVFANLVHILKEQGLTPNELMDIYAGSQHTPNNKFVPIGIFATKLSPSESLCKYLKENVSLSYKDISRLLNRDERSIWTSHNRAKDKMPEPFSDAALQTTNLIPIDIFANRNLSILENLVLYLREKTKVTNYKIAKTLNKTPSMIYTIYHRARAKVAKMVRPIQRPISRPAREISRPAKPLPPKQPAPRMLPVGAKRLMKKKKPAKKKRLRLRDYLR